MRAAKLFVEWTALGLDGMFDEMPTPRTVWVQWRRFKGAWIRDYRPLIEEVISSQMKNVRESFSS